MTYTLFQNHKTGIYYLQNRVTRKQESLRTRDLTEAGRLLHARNEAASQPAISRQIGAAYLHAADPRFLQRTWREVALMYTQPDNAASTRLRNETALRQGSLQPLLRLRLSETTADILLNILRACTHSGLSYARRWYNLAIDFGWIPMNLLPRKRWPKIRCGVRRAVTRAEHEKLLASVRDDGEWPDYLQALWWLGAAQTDLATLTADRVSLPGNQIRFKRTKITDPGRGWTCATMGPSLRSIIEKRLTPGQPLLFPTLATMRNSHRSSWFKRRCQRLGLPDDLTLHCYRYAVIQRAEACNYPKRLAMRLVGHDREQTHADYGRTANIQVPSLEAFEAKLDAGTVLPFVPEEHFNSA